MCVGEEVPSISRIKLLLFCYHLYMIEKLKNKKQYLTGCILGVGSLVLYSLAGPVAYSICGGYGSNFCNPYRVLFVVYGACLALFVLGIYSIFTPAKRTSRKTSRQRKFSISSQKAILSLIIISFLVLVYGVATDSWLIAMTVPPVLLFLLGLYVIRKMSSRKKL